MLDAYMHSEQYLLLSDLQHVSFAVNNYYVSYVPCLQLVKLVHVSYVLCLQLVKLVQGNIYFCFIYSEASLIRTPLIWIIHLSGHMFGNQ